MNPAGIAVFYGAFDPETCLAEIRLPVGGLAFTASFQLVRPIRVFDLTVLKEAIQGVSWLHPSFDHVTEQWAFLSRFHDEIGRPILQHEEHLEFIPTQVVAEYLAHRFKPSLDGVIYSSPQTGGTGLNIALFHHASGVATRGKVVLKSRAPAQIEVGDADLVISEPPSTPEEGPVDELVPALRPAFWEEPDPADHPDVEMARTIEFVADSLECWRVVSANQNIKRLTIVDLRGSAADTLF